MLDMLGYVDFGTREDRVTGVTVHDRERTEPGLNLVTYPSLGRAELVDADGRVVHAWAARDPGDEWYRAHLLPDGDVLVVGRPSGLSRRAPDGRVRWQVARSVHATHHFVQPLPDGRIAGLVSKRRWRLGYGRLRVVDDSLAVFSPTGELLEQHGLLALARRHPWLRIAEEPDRARKKDAIDLFHTNRLHWLTDASLDGPHPLMRPGLVLLTLRHQDSLVLFDPETERVHWTWGRGILGLPHDGQVLPDGHVLVFDNTGLGEASRIVEVDPLRDEIVWSYRADPPSDFHSAARGTVQRLPGGHTLVGESNEGRAFEVTPGGEIVWEYRTPHRDAEGRPAVLRIERYAERDVALALRADAGAPTEPDARTAEAARTGPGTHRASRP